VASSSFSHPAAGPRDREVEVVLAGGGGRVDLVISALRDDNPGPGLSVVDRGHDVTVRAPERIVLTAATLGWHLGRGFDLRRLRPMVVSCVGRLEVGRDELVWTSQGVPGSR
jgi:MmoB/DmpM family